MKFSEALHVLRIGVQSLLAWDAVVEDIKKASIPVETNSGEKTLFVETDYVLAVINKHLNEVENDNE